MTKLKIVHAIPREPREDVVVGSVPDRCKCGGTLTHGYGFAGGGLGPYAICEECGTFYKCPEEDGEE